MGDLGGEEALGVTPTGVLGLQNYSIRIYSAPFCVIDRLLIRSMDVCH